LGEIHSCNVKLREKDERLKVKDERLKVKDERLKVKDERLKVKDEMIEMVMESADIAMELRERKRTDSRRNWSEWTFVSNIFSFLSILRLRYPCKDLAKAGG
jgi:hypothetical protein